MVLKFLRTIRNHWKKSTFAACAVTYGANYAKESYEIQNLMENYCQEALSYGMQPLQPTENPRKVLVVLNPTANRRKAIKQFEKYCVPILHLAGISIEVVQTKSEGHARTILEEHKDKTDAIVIAGGDGTISESITGLLRRADALETCPIGVLPLGRENSFASSLFREESRDSPTVNHVRTLGDASMAIVRNCTKTADVMRIEIMPDGQGGEAPSKPVFALTGVEWGSYRDAHSKREKYWYFGRLRKYATYIFNGYKSNLNWNCAGNITFSPPCSGCSNCYKQDSVPEQQRGRWWNSFVQQAAPKPNEFQFVVNENCANTRQKSISTTDFNLTVGGGGTSELVLKLGPQPGDVSYLDFVKEGWTAENGGARKINETINARQIEVYPDENQSQMHFYSIDHEDFEVKPIRVTLLPKLIKIFYVEQL